MVKKEQNKTEQIGFHKGALSTLLKEHQELGKMVGIVEQLIKLHVGSLKKLGVDISTTKQSNKLDDKFAK